jgi:hypothetical protein
MWPLRGTLCWREGAAQHLVLPGVQYDQVFSDKIQVESCHEPLCRYTPGVLFLIFFFCNIKTLKSLGSWHLTYPLCRYTAGDVLRITYADVCWRMLTYAGVCWRMLTYADVCWRMLTYVDVCWRMLTHSLDTRRRAPDSRCRHKGPQPLLPHSKKKRKKEKKFS